MYCILVTGIPAAGKSTLAAAVAEKLGLPLISKDAVKELLFDFVGFRSREEKVKLGTASMEIMYKVAGELMKAGQPFILENNFEYSSEPGLKALLEKYSYFVLTITLTGDYKVIYQRFLERESSPERHRGHVVNDCYPQKTESGSRRRPAAISYDSYIQGIKQRGFDAFTAGGRQIRVDTTDFCKVDMEQLVSQILAWREGIVEG